VYTIAVLITSIVALQTCRATDEQTLAPGIKAILAAYKGSWFVDSTPANDGTVLYWLFGMPNEVEGEEGHYIFVNVPSYCDTEHLGAYYTTAVDAIHFHKTGKKPYCDQIEYQPTIIGEILKTYSRVQFLGVGANKDQSGLRWIFCVPADENNPDVIVNVSPEITTVIQFKMAYVAAYMAVKLYDKWGDTPPSKESSEPVMKPDPEMDEYRKRMDSTPQPSMDEQIARFKAQDAEKEKKKKIFEGNNKKL
jgi:hypothetical protein